MPYTILAYVWFGGFDDLTPEGAVLDGMVLVVIEEDLTM